MDTDTQEGRFNIGPFTDMAGLRTIIEKNYEGAQYHTPDDFEALLEQYIFHEEEMLSFLRSVYWGQDLSTHFVYFSISGGFLDMELQHDIPGGHCVKAPTGANTRGFESGCYYVTSPEELSSEVRAQYDLAFHSRPLAQEAVPVE